MAWIDFASEVLEIQMQVPLHCLEIGCKVVEKLPGGSAILDFWDVTLLELEDAFYAASSAA